jgi:chemotaxis protein methyltransferase CheR
MPAELDDFVVFCRGLQRLTGANLDYYKRHQMERRARGLATRAGAGDLTDYLTILRRDPAQLAEFMSRMTITVSQLWRNPEIFDAIGDELLPELAQIRSGQRLRLWCAGCSYGAEPYTLAAVCLDHMDKIGKPPLIIASDVNETMIKHAREGRYTAEDARSAPEHLVARHFEHLPDGGLLAKPELRELIRFKREDLFKAAHPPMDLILCRNVAIHFKPESRDRLHQILANTLAPGGMLVLGNTEMIVHPGELGLERVRAFVFRRLARNGQEPTSAAAKHKQ